MATLVLAGSSQTLTLTGAQTLEGSPQPQVTLHTIPGRSGDKGQATGRRSSVYVATGFLKNAAASDYTDFMSKLETMLAGQASSTIVATYTHIAGVVLLNAVNVWIEKPPHVKSRKGPEVVLADWEIEMTIRE